MKISVLIFVVAIALVSCKSQPNSAPSAPNASVAIATSQPKAIQEKAIAKVSLVEEKPVSVISKKDNKETDANLGMGLYVADKVRTQGKGRTQIEFDNGIGLRIGGNSTVQIKPNNRLNLTEGEMLTWVKPGLKVPTEISTAYATATIRGTTAYVEIPKDLSKGVRFFSWEGTVVVKLANQSKEIILLTGEEVIVKPNSTTPPVVRRMNLNEWREISKTSPLLRSFASPLPTQNIIDNLVPGQASLDQSPPTKQPKVEDIQGSQGNQDQGNQDIQGQGNQDNLDSPKDADNDRDDDDRDDDDRDDDDRDDDDRDDDDRDDDDE